MSATCQHETWRELAFREKDGLAVSLLWSHDLGRVKVAVVDARLDEHFDVHVSSADALDAFRHPFAYAAGMGATFGGLGSSHGRHFAPERSTVS